jgi:tetratricopeptide (TPR) repeat protein
VKSADYQRYLVLRRRMETGEVLGRPEIDALEEITRSSPDLVSAYVLASGTARGLPDHARADAILRAAEVIHRDDPRVVSERFALALDAGRLEEAKAALASLESVSPGDVRVWRARAALLAREGKLPEAAEMQMRLVRERPSWKNLWYLADVEMKLADAKGAREHLDQLLQVSPGNPRGLAKMAELEWSMGDPSKAARIYEGLLKEKVTRQNLSNLGWSLLLAGDYPGAAAAYRRALDLEPDHLSSRLNLGIAGRVRVDTEAARVLYRDVLTAWRRRERRAALTGPERLIKAQALARSRRPVRGGGPHDRGSRRRGSRRPGPVPGRRSSTRSAASRTTRSCRHVKPGDEDSRRNGSPSRVRVTARDAGIPGAADSGLTRRPERARRVSASGIDWTRAVLSSAHPDSAGGEAGRSRSRRA